MSELCGRGAISFTYKLFDLSMKNSTVNVPTKCTSLIILFTSSLASCSYHFAGTMVLNNI